MVKILHIFLAISLNLIKDVSCVELVKEQAWTENLGIDNFFNKAELTESNRYYYNINGGNVKSYSSNLDLELFHVSAEIK